MSITYVSPGIALRSGSGQLVLWRQLAGAPPATGDDAGSGPDLSSLNGLTAWWDAGSFNDLSDLGGRPLFAWNQAVGALQDKSGMGHSLLPFTILSSSGPAMARGRLNQLLGGVGRITGAGGWLSPALDPDLGFRCGEPLIPGPGAWTLYLVWSRPNWRQNSGSDSNAITLASVGNVAILQADSKGSQARLVLFPGQAPTVLTNALERRHTHAVVVRFDGAGNATAWLDGGTPILVGGLPSSVGASGSLTLLHDGTARGAAQCWLHESAVWQRALNDAEIDVIRSWSNRWEKGSRRGINFVITGQSNAINYALNDGAAAILGEGIAWHLGLLACNFIATAGVLSNATMQSGHGIYPALGGSYPGSFLDDPGTGADPSTWNLGADGLALQTALNSLPAEDKEDIAALVWLWSETDSLRSYGEKVTFKAAAARLLSLTRGMLSLSAARLPLVWWNAIPYGSDDGIQMHREVVSELAQDDQQVVVIGNPQTSDSNARGSTIDPVSGTATGGDPAHRDSIDNQRFAYLAAPVVAQAVLASGRQDLVSQLPTSLSTRGGPQLVHAYRQSDTEVLLTVQHDAGNDLKLPGRSVSGAGFSVIDGGSIAQPGHIISTSSCMKIDSYHVLITLAEPLTGASEQCFVLYPYGPVAIGRGNCITDNYSEVAKLPGWDISSDLGPAWRIDRPLAATFHPLPLSESFS